MIAIAELRKTAREHLRLAGILHKSRICRALRWPQFPTDEFGRDIGLRCSAEHGMGHVPSIVLSGLEINRGVIITANPETARVAETAALAAA